MKKRQKEKTEYGRYQYFHGYAPSPVREVIKYIKAEWQLSTVITMSGWTESQLQKLAAQIGYRLEIRGTTQYQSGRKFFRKYNV